MISTASYFMVLSIRFKEESGMVIRLSSH